MNESEQCKQTWPLISNSIHIHDIFIQQLMPNNMTASLDIAKFSFSLSNPEVDCRTVCGGRKFKRHFSKKDYPLLGEEDKESGDKNPLWLTSRSKDLLPKTMSLTVSEVRKWYMDPKTGKWRWPLNGADLVYPGIYLGDA
jgi:hypothetical protein